MDALNTNWLNAQASRRYPLDDNATGTGDDGTRLNDDVIVDLHLRWPAVAGQYAFLSGVTVTASILTAVILAADTTTAVSGFTPLASITIKQPATEYAFYNLEPLYPGVGGFIAFGDVQEPFSIRFSTPQQGLLAPKVGRPYAALPIPTMRKFGRNDGLTGLVKILGGTDIDIVKDVVDVDGTSFDALVIRLQSPTSARNPLADYIGPCGVRPESDNCDRQGVQTLNGIAPDCNGNIEIEFRGMLAANYPSCGAEAAGVVIEQDLGIDDVCPSRVPTRFDGVDYCGYASSVSLGSLGSESYGSYSLGSVGGSSNSSASVVACSELPFYECFAGSIHDAWMLQRGSYQFVEAARPDESLCLPESTQVLQLRDTAQRNILTWDDCGMGLSIRKRVVAYVQLTDVGAQQNAGVVLNYHLVDPLTNPRIKYFLVQINRNANRVELLSYNGSNLITENFVTPALPFELTDWYAIQATVSLAAGGVRISVLVQNITTPSWPQISFQLLTNRWGDSDGTHGVHTTQAVSNFGFWSLENA